MNVLVVHMGELNEYPPVLNLINILLRMEYNVTLICYDSENATDKYRMRDVEVYLIDRAPKNLIKKVTYYFKRRLYLRKLVKSIIAKFDIIWTTTDFTAIEIGKDILLNNKKHIMQLMELVEDIPEIRTIGIKKAGLKYYAQNAYSVVVPEYNRSAITKVWYDLEKTPFVLPNKPFSLDEVPTDELIEKESENIFKKMRDEKKKIILYQGAFREDRNLAIIQEAIQKTDEYRLYIMGRDNDYRKELCYRYPDIVYLGYIAPPYHTMAGQYAHIGLLPYKPVKEKTVSELNALYCAPNKIYEYAKFGLPMIGSDVPGLFFPFEKYQIGKCYDENSIDSVLEAIQIIEMNFAEYSNNCKSFYDDTNLMKIVGTILS